MLGSEPHNIFDSAEGYGPVSGLIAVGDPDVHFIGDRWTMLLGAGHQQGAGGVDLISASLPVGAQLTSDELWSINVSEGGSAQRLIASPPVEGGFDEWRHTPCLARGSASRNHEEDERLYYTGSAGGDDFATRSMAIGVAVRENGSWVPQSEPIVHGDEERPCVLEPKVVYVDGVWRMWYQATHHEAGPGELPDTEIRYTESSDGISGWSDPVVVASGLFDVAPEQLPDGSVHLLAAAAPNMHGPVTGLPPQGLWSTVVPTSGAAETINTQDFSQFPSVEQNAAGWFARGPYGPCTVVAPGGEGHEVLHVFFTAMAEPEPFRMSVGRLEVPLSRIL